MRRNSIIITLFIALTVGLFSCSTKVDLYSDYKDITIVYGLLDMTKDTNYVKIIRAFSGNHDSNINANDIALIPDSSNYPGKLDVSIAEYRHQGYGNTFYPTGRVFVLDTITLHNKVQGTFYAPDQKVYYTTGNFLANDEQSNTQYKYRLEIRKENDTISSETGIVGGNGFNIITSEVDFDTTSNRAKKIQFNPSFNASVYEIKMQFNYKEQLPGGEMTDKKIEWSLGTFDINSLPQDSKDKRYVTYKPETFWNLLEIAIGDNTLNADRIVGDFNVLIAAGGTELYNYIEINSPNNSISQNIPDYTNITGGYGVFSSRINKSKKMRLKGYTQFLLISHPGWGFRLE